MALCRALRCVKNEAMHRASPGDQSIGLALNMYGTGLVAGTTEDACCIKCICDLSVLQYARDRNNWYFE